MEMLLFISSSGGDPAIIVAMKPTNLANDFSFSVAKRTWKIRKKYCICKPKEVKIARYLLQLAIICMPRSIHNYLFRIYSKFKHPRE